MNRLLLAVFVLISAPIHANEKIHSGSGYDAVDGSVVNYTYNNFGGLYLTVENHTIRWEGFHGYFLGLVSANPPQVSEVAPDVFLYSWQTRGSGSDNVVHNYNTMRVSAHLQPDDGAGESIQMIHGVVHCRNTPQCDVPSTELTTPERFGPVFAGNHKEFGYPPLFDPTSNNTPRAAPDIAAWKELANHALSYDTPEGRYRVEVDGAETRVSIAGGEPETFQTYATKLADGLYFISWMGGIGGTHLVVNTDTRKVFDHILPTGERRESIYQLACFGASVDC